MNQIPSSLGPVTTKVFLAVLAERQPTVSTTVMRTGLNRSVVHYHLRKLKAEGLVRWTEGQRGTLRASYRPVDISGIRP